MELRPPRVTGSGGRAPRRRRARRLLGGAAAAGHGVVVDAVVGGDDVEWVVAVPLHALLHAALGRRAPVVAPACVSPENFYT